jgi:hypothetical protein
VPPKRTVDFALPKLQTLLHCMSHSALAPICFITPTYRGEIEPFAQLRRSIGLFAPGLPHLAIVNTEDHACFADRFGRERNLEITTTAAVLPTAIERHRRRSAVAWLTARWLRRRVIRSWHVRQLTRIYALANCSYESAAFIDSDAFITEPVTPGDFYVDGRLKLCRHRALAPECLDADIATHEILGNPLHQVTELFDYRFSPACFRKSTATALLAEFERRRRSRWVRRFIAQQRPSEYNLLGYAATVLEHGAGYHLLECNPETLQAAEGAFQRAACGLSQSFLPSSCPATE